jgi:hypothetical protein
MKYAWIENERIRDICEGGNPADCYTANIAAYYDTLVPDEAKDGDGYVNGQWIPAPPPPPTPAPPQTWTDVGVRSGLTLADKTKWDNNETPEIVTAKKEFLTPQQLAYTTELLEYLVASNSISQTSMDQVLAETPEQSNPGGSVSAVNATLIVSGTVPDVIV